MSTWESGVEFDVMLSNLWWNSLQVNIIPFKNVFILPEQCFGIKGSWSSQCHIQLNYLQIFGSPQIEQLYLVIFK
jgi:hypothetical protein